LYWASDSFDFPPHPPSRRGVLLSCARGP
jgi:hypothetical protein